MFIILWFSFSETWGLHIFKTRNIAVKKRRWSVYNFVFLYSRKILCSRANWTWYCTFHQICYPLEAATHSVPNRRTFFFVVIVRAYIMIPSPHCDRVGVSHSYRTPCVEYIRLTTGQYVSTAVSGPVLRRNSVAATSYARYRGTNISVASVEIRRKLFCAPNRNLPV